MVNIAVPHIQYGLHFSATSLSLVLNGYTLNSGGLPLLGCRAGDILYRRRVFIAGIAPFMRCRTSVSVIRSSQCQCTGQVGIRYRREVCSLAPESALWSSRQSGLRMTPDRTPDGRPHDRSPATETLQDPATPGTCHPAARLLRLKPHGSCTRKAGLDDRPSPGFGSSRVGEGVWPLASVSIRGLASMVDGAAAIMKIRAFQAARDAT